MWAVVPGDVEGGSALHGGPCVPGYDDDAARRIDAKSAGWNFEDLEHSWSRKRAVCVEFGGDAAECGASGNDGVDHAGNPHIEAELRCSGNLSWNIEMGKFVTDKIEVLRVLELHVFGVGERDAACVLDKFAVRGFAA